MRSDLTALPSPPVHLFKGAYYKVELLLTAVSSSNHVISTASTHSLQTTIEIWSSTAAATADSGT